ncbi:MAG: hypothetical protein Q7S32_01785 [bacterium]|nr:hypothetical protein [bacterium]
MIDISFANSFSAGIALVVGILANCLVFINARKIGGGALATVYNYFGIGMLFNLAGFAISIMPIDWVPLLTSFRAHDILFIIGYTAMAVGAKKILDAAGLK